MSVKWAKYRVDRLILAISSCLCAGQLALPGTWFSLRVTCKWEKGTPSGIPFRNGTTLLQGHLWAALNEEIESCCQNWQPRVTHNRVAAIT